LWAWSGWAARRPRHIVLAVAVANLLLPSVYVSPYFRRPFGVVWTPGLYSVYDGFAANTVATK
ncbi:MAG: hypothetical protein ACREE3_12740, partial [Stellaceae bacterium]